MTYTPTRFLSVTEAAAVLGVSRRTAYSLVRARQVPSIRLGGCIKVPAAALDQWLAERQHEALAVVRPRDLGP
jgi:excisionase family DNA binding protein